MNATQQRARRIKRDHPTYGSRTALQMARGYAADDDMAGDLADTIDTFRTISTDDYDDAPAGWTLSASVDHGSAEPDPEGTFTQHPTADSIDRRRFGWHEGSHEYRYWTPGPYSFEDYRSDGRRFGMARHAAWLYAWERLTIDEKRDRSAHLLTLVVTASREDVDLGTASIGFSTSDEDDSDPGYMAHPCADLWPEAIESAQATLARLAPAR